MTTRTQTSFAAGFAVSLMAIGLAFAFALLWATPVEASPFCAYNSTQASCACPTSGPGITCTGGQLYKSASPAGCYDDPRVGQSSAPDCASNQRLDCASGLCVCDTPNYPCTACQVATSTNGQSCSSDSNCPANGGQYANVCSNTSNSYGQNAYKCPSGTTLCSATSGVTYPNTCVANRICPAGTTWNPCNDSCDTPNVLLSPGEDISAPFTQSGYIKINGDITTTGGDVFVAGNVNSDNGYCIGTDCVLGWADLSVWDQAGNDIYNTNTGNVGIGTLTPQSKLHLQGSGTGFGLTLTNSGNSVGRQGMRMSFDNNRLTFQRASDTGAWEADYLAIDQDTGMVGIGTTSPTADLHVQDLSMSADKGIYVRTGSGQIGTSYGEYLYHIQNYSGETSTTTYGMYARANNENNYAPSTTNIYPTAYGVYGYADAPYITGTYNNYGRSYGVFGSAGASYQGYGMYGSASGSRYNYALYGYGSTANTSNIGYGVYGYVYGYGSSGVNYGGYHYIYGASATGSQFGEYNYVYGANATGTKYASYNFVNANGGSGTSYGSYNNVQYGTTAYAGYFSATNATTNYGIYVASSDKNYIDSPLGIGTPTPNAQLHVKTGSGNAEIDIQSASLPHWGIYHDSNGASENYQDLVFWNGDNRFVIRDNGDVDASGCFGPIFVGFTTGGGNPYNGSLNGTASGYTGANALCTASYSGSHVCTPDEVIRTITCSSSSVPASGTGWVNNGPPGFTSPAANDCGGWTSNASSSYGTFWEFASGTGGKGSATACNVALPLSCCK